MRRQDFDPAALARKFREKAVTPPKKVEYLSLGATFQLLVQQMAQQVTGRPPKVFTLLECHVRPEDNRNNAFFLEGGFEQGVYISPDEEIV